MTETVEIDQRAVAQYVLFAAMEQEDIETYIPEGVRDDDVWDGLTANNVEHVDGDGNSVFIEGRFKVREVVDRIPASGGGRLEPPTNPPEVITEDREAHFLIRFDFEDEGYATGEVEVI